MINYISQLVHLKLSFVTFYLSNTEKKVLVVFFFCVQSIHDLCYISIIYIKMETS